MLTEEGVSLATKICIRKEELKTVFRTVLEEFPNGTEVINDQLDGLKEVDTDAYLIFVIFSPHTHFWAFFIEF